MKTGEHTSCDFQMFECSGYVRCTGQYPHGYTGWERVRRKHSKGVPSIATIRRVPVVVTRLISSSSVALVPCHLVYIVTVGGKYVLSPPLIRDFDNCLSSATAPTVLAMSL
ncbi:hypothetical protein SCLCIDRAFT_959356 [Scleroderma citrinum Foug A]|uniref:Uncharacterized protein n=1 Tax=Scleroderma citrinum Foug A TaxID=1036808 RepID=A0A0C3EKT0_9AGAM|nr:hypothetical protein SCLCIDRAFT_959356 [Scleroderma citrinum Foug A]